MITRRELASALSRRGIADWVLIERDQEHASIDERTRTRRVEKRLLWQVTVHVDTPQGRGSAHTTIDAVDGLASAAIDQTIALAQNSLGPAWIQRPLAAPARVKLEDLSVAKLPVLDIAADIAKKLKRTGEVTARVGVLRERVTVAGRQDFRTEWRATLFRVDAMVAADERSMLIAREARERVAIAGDPAIADAAADLKLLATAAPATSGPCALVLGAEALTHQGLGVWAAFVAQADAVVERQGLTRYRERGPIAKDAEQVPEPLTITSNGARDFGVRSAPLGDHGDAVRKFRIVERGIAVGLGLTPREAALRGRDPNGGVRNLEVALGTWPGTIEVGAVRVVEVRRLRSLAIDPYTGDASLEIALGVEHTKAGAKPFTGGSLRIDLIAALARARRSSREIVRGPYTGPDAVLIDNAELIA